MTGRADIEHRFALQLHRLVAASGSVAHKYAFETGLGVTDFAALVHIWESSIDQRPVTASQLAVHLGVTPSAITHLVDRLAERSYVERIRDPQDRRRIILRLVLPGHEVSHGFLAPLADGFSHVLADHSDDELDELTALLNQLTAVCTQLTTDPKDSDTLDD